MAVFDADADADVDELVGIVGVATAAVDVTRTVEVCPALFVVVMTIVVGGCEVVGGGVVAELGGGVVVSWLDVVGGVVDEVLLELSCDVVDDEKRLVVAAVVGSALLTADAGLLLASELDGGSEELVGDEDGGWAADVTVGVLVELEAIVNCLYFRRPDRLQVPMSARRTIVD